MSLFIGAKKNNERKYYDKLFKEDKKDNFFKEKIDRGGYVYGIIEGRDGNDNLLIFDKKKDLYKKYSLDCVANDMDVYKDNLYYIHTEHNGKNTSYITKISSIDITNKATIRTKIDNIVLSHIAIYEDNVYVFGFDYDNKGIFSKMYVYNGKDLELKKEIDFGDYIVDVTDTYMDKNKLYVCGRSSRKKQDNDFVEIDNRYICEIDKKDYSIRKIYIGDISYQVMVLNSKIYVSNYDEVFDEGNVIYEIDCNLGMRKRHVMNKKVKDIYKYYNEFCKN